MWYLDLMLGTVKVLLAYHLSDLLIPGMAWGLNKRIQIKIAKLFKQYILNFISTYCVFRFFLTFMGTQFNKL